MRLRKLSPVHWIFILSEKKVEIRKAKSSESTAIVALTNESSLYLQYIVCHSEPNKKGTRSGYELLA